MAFDCLKASKDSINCAIKVSSRGLSILTSDMHSELPCDHVYDRTKTNSDVITWNMISVLYGVKKSPNCLWVIGWRTSNRTARCCSTGPVSNSCSPVGNRMALTPTTASPESSVCIRGHGPRHRGSNDGWIFTQPCPKAAINEVGKNRPNDITRPKRPECFRLVEDGWSRRGSLCQSLTREATSLAHA